MNQKILKNTRTSVKLIGFLFLITMAFSIFGNLTIAGLISEEEYLPNVNSERYMFSLAAVAMFLNSLGVLGIGVFAYTLLRRINESLAITYLITRIFEGVILTVGIISLLTLVSLGQDLIGQSATANTDLYALGKIAIKTNWYAYNCAMAALGIGSMPFCLVLFKLKIVPRMLSLLGLIGYAILATSSISAMIGIDLGLMITIPVFFFEVILGFWLIWKGIRFNDK